MSRQARTRLYIASVAVFALILGTLSSVFWSVSPQFERLWMLPTFAALIAVAGRFPFRVSPQGDATVLTAPLFTAVLLLHPLEALAVGVAGAFISERSLRAPLNVMLFNVSATGLTAVVAGIAFWFVRPEVAPLFSLGFMAAAVFAGLLLHVVNHSLTLGMITIVKGRAFWSTWRDAWAFEAILDSGLLIVGLIAAQMLSIAWWWLIVITVPFAIIYFGFRSTIEQTAEKTVLADKLERNLAELTQTQEQLIQSAKLAGLGTLAAGLAHEINNPLTIITGRAELFSARLKMSPDFLTTEKALADIEDIHSMGIRISTIMKQLLSYSRRAEFLEEISLDSVLSDSVELLKGKADKKGVEIVQQYASLPIVRGVPTQLQQVFVNIISNAIDASPEMSQVILSCSNIDGVAVISVTDKGCGMPEEVREHIFEPFYTTKNAGEGTGLGLFIGHKIVSDHEGEITLDSKEGEGTTFRVLLPVLKNSAALEGKKTNAA